MSVIEMALGPEADETLLRFLRQQVAMRETMMRPVPEGFVHLGIEAWVLAEGRPWPVAPLPPTMRRGLPRHCFLNAFQAAKRDRRLRYVEGYAIGVIPVIHAWCVDPEDRVLEVTWEQPGAAYYGAVFTLAEVRRLHRTSQSLSMLDDWERGYPLLRGERRGAA